MSFSGVVLVLLLVRLGVHGDPMCRNAGGEAVDWWIMLKRPKSSAYAYIDSSQQVPAFQLHEEADLTARTGNPLAETVSGVYAEDVWHVAYNDQLWHRTAPGFWNVDFKWDESAHAKGILGFQKEQGFWITHSTPKFPNSPSFYEFYTGVDNCNEQQTWCGKGRGQLLEGQSFFCVTLTTAALELVAATLKTIAPIVYSSRLRGSDTAFPAVNALVADSDARAHGASPAFGVSKEVVLASAAGTQLLLFVKAPSGGNDSRAIYLYEEVIEPHFKTGFRVQTWRQNGSFPSFCPDKGICPEEFCPPSIANSSFETLVINRVNISPTFRWRTGSLADDHSKWVVSGTSWYPDTLETDAHNGSPTPLEPPRKPRTLLVSMHPNKAQGNASLETLVGVDGMDAGSDSITSVHGIEGKQEGLRRVSEVQQRGSWLGLGERDSTRSSQPDEGGDRAHQVREPALAGKRDSTASGQPVEAGERAHRVGEPALAGERDSAASAQPVEAGDRAHRVGEPAPAGDPTVVVSHEEGTPPAAWVSPVDDGNATASETGPAAKVVCFSDVNRAGTQLARGGGAICFVNHPGLWAAFDRIVAGVGACGKL